MRNNIDPTCVPNCKVVQRNKAPDMWQFVTPRANLCAQCSTTRRWVVQQTLRYRFLGFTKLVLIGFTKLVLNTAILNGMTLHLQMGV